MSFIAGCRYLMTDPTMSSSCAIPASSTDHPFSGVRIFSYLSERCVTTCIRVGLSHRKKGLLSFPCLVETCPEATGMKETKKFLKTVAAVAQKWDIAILATVGAPKQKGNKKDRYTLTRDRVFGSVAWGRLTSTLLDISLTVEEDPDSVRLIQVLPRTGRRERFYFEFEDGRLVYRDVTEGGRSHGQACGG